MAEKPGSGGGEYYDSSGDVEDYSREQKEEAMADAAKTPEQRREEERERQMAQRVAVAGESESSRYTLGKDELAESRVEVKKAASSAEDGDSEAQTTSGEGLVKIEEAKVVSAQVIKKALELVRAEDRPDKKDLAEYVARSVEDAPGKVEQSGGRSFEVSDSDGNAQQEGVPVDRLINLLLDQIDPDGRISIEAETKDSGRGTFNLRDLIVHPADGIMYQFNRLQQAERSGVSELEQQIADDIGFILSSEEVPEDARARLALVKELLLSSERYFDIDRPGSRVDPVTGKRDLNHWRTRLEAYYASQDHRAKGSPEPDYEKAMDELYRRREVFIGERERAEEGFVGVAPGEAMVRREEAEGAIPPAGEGPPTGIVPSEKPAAAEVAEGRRAERIVIADASEVVKAMAWRIAEQRLNEIVNYASSENRQTQARRSGFLGRLAGIGRALGTKFFTYNGWRSTFAVLGEQGYLRKFYNEAVEEIQNNQDLMADIQGRLTGRSESAPSRGKKGDKGEHYEVLDAVVRQVEEEVLEASEEGRDIEGIGNRFAELIQKHVTGEPGYQTRPEFEEKVREVIEQLVENGTIRKEDFSVKADRSGEAEGLVYATNLWEIAQAQRRRISEMLSSGELGELSPEQQGVAAEIVGAIGNLDVRLANKLRDLNEERAARPDRRPSYLTSIERFTNGCRSHPVAGAFLNPTVLGLFAALGTRRGLAAAGIGTATAIGLGYAAPVLVALGIGAGFAYHRRRRNLAYDRGMEQRRETLGSKGRGRRAERLRELGFSDISQDARALTGQINAGDQDALLKAAALLEAERILMDQGRPVDLITISGEQDQRLETTLPAKTELKIAVKQRESSIDQNELGGRVAEIVRDVRAQDREFEGYRRRESWKAAGAGAAWGAAVGLAAQEVLDFATGGAENEQITLLEYARGQRPQIEHYIVSGVDGEFQLGDRVSLPVTIPETGEQVDVRFELGEGGKLSPVEGTLPPEFQFDPESGEIIYEVAGVSGGELTADNWGELRDHLEGQYGFIRTPDDGQSSWRIFYHNDTPPFRSSYDFPTSRHGGWAMRSDRLELCLDLHSGHEEGEVVIDISRMIGKHAYAGGHRLDVDQDSLQEMVATISPRGTTPSPLERQTILLEFNDDGKIVLPREVSEMFFQETPRGIMPKDGFILTVSHDINGDGSSLGHVAAEYRQGSAQISEIPGVKEEIPIPEAEYVPPAELAGLYGAPVSGRWAIGDPGKDKKRDTSQPSQDEPSPPVPEEDPPPAEPDEPASPSREDEKGGAVPSRERMGRREVSALIKELESARDRSARVDALVKAEKMLLEEQKVAGRVEGGEVGIALHLAKMPDRELEDKTKEVAAKLKKVVREDRGSSGHQAVARGKAETEGTKADGEEEGKGPTETDRVRERRIDLTLRDLTALDDEISRAIYQRNFEDRKKVLVDLGRRLKEGRFNIGDTVRFELGLDLRQKDGKTKIVPYEELKKEDDGAILKALEKLKEDLRQILADRRKAQSGDSGARRGPSRPQEKLPEVQAKAA